MTHGISLKIWEKNFQNYLVAGVYPYYRTTGKSYHQQILNTVSRVTDIDLPAIFNIDYSSTRQVKKLLAVMASSTPFTPNISKLARDLEMNRTSVLTYLDYLDSASLIHVLRSGLKSDAALAKPDKVLIENPNLHFPFLFRKHQYRQSPRNLLCLCL